MGACGGGRGGGLEEEAVLCLSEAGDHSSEAGGWGGMCFC